MKTTLYTVPASLLLLGISHDVLANADSWEEIAGDFDHYSNTNPYQRNTVKMTYQRQATSTTQYAVSGASHRIHHKNARYSGQEVNGKIRHQISPQVTLEGQLGAVKLNKPQGRSETIPTHKVRAEWQARHNVSFALQHQGDALFREEIAVDSGNKVIRTQATSVEAFARPTKRTNVSGRLQHKRYSDGNHSRDAYVSGFYGATPAQDPRLWAGVEAWHLDHDRTEAAYWSPKNYRYAGVKVYGDTPISKNVSLTGSLSKGRSKEAGSNGSISAFSATVGAKFKVNSNADIRLEARHGDSYRSGDRWEGNGVMLSFNHRF